MPGSPHPVALERLTDVDLGTVADNDVLQYDSATGVWTNSAVTAALSVDDLTDVTITGTPADNEILAYDTGTGEWINQTAAEAGLGIGADVQAWDAGLDALAALDGTAGVMVQTAADTFGVVTLTGTANQIDIANGDGSGTPTFSTPQDIHSAATPEFAGLGVGIAAPDGTAHVHTATAGVVTAHTSADDLVVENSATGGITVLTPDNVGGNLYFGSPSDSIVGQIISHHDNAELTVGTHITGGDVVFRTGVGSEVARFTGSNFGVGVTPTSTIHAQAATGMEMHLENTGNDVVDVLLNADVTSANAVLARIRGEWNGNIVNQISFQAGADTVNKDEGYLRFWTAPPGGTIAERLRIDTAGYLGTGGVTPTEHLHLYHATEHTTLLVESAGVDTNPALSLTNDAQTWQWQLQGTAADKLVLKSGSTVVLRIDPGAMTDTIRVDSGGDVGFGKNPAAGAKIDINLATEDAAIVDAGSAGATQQDWIEVTVGGVTGYLHVFSAV